MKTSKLSKGTFESQKNLSLDTSNKNPTIENKSHTNLKAQQLGKIHETPKQREKNNIQIHDLAPTKQLHLKIKSRPRIRRQPQNIYNQIMGNSFTHNTTSINNFEENATDNPISKVQLDLSNNLDNSMTMMLDNESPQKILFQRELKPVFKKLGVPKQELSMGIQTTQLEPVYNQQMIPRKRIQSRNNKQSFKYKS